MRIVAGAWKGRRLIAPLGTATRPTADRARQALFDMLMHAPWGGRALLDGATILDGFAGTGALGLEALSRGAARAHFIEPDAAALKALTANIAQCGARDVQVWRADMLAPPRGEPCSLVFLDPPYGRAFIEQTLPRLAERGWLAPGAVIVGETGVDDPIPTAAPLLDSRVHGAARVSVWRERRPRPAFG